MLCPNCGREIADLAAVCVNCGTDIKKSNASALDKPSAILNILSFFIPMLGFICWAAMSGTTPRKGKACGIASIIGLVCCALLYIAYIVLAILFNIAAFEGMY